MSPSAPLVSVLAMIVTLGAACTPAGSAGVTPRACADSAPEATATATATREPQPEAAPIAPDVTTGSTPEVAPPPSLPSLPSLPCPPRPPVAARPMVVPQPAGP